MKIKILKLGCRSGGRQHGVGAVIDLKDDDGKDVKEIPPLWKGKAEIFVEKKRQSEPKKEH